MEIRRVERIYDDLAPVWDRRQGAGERVMIGQQMRSRFAAALRGDVLEIGTGTGSTLSYLDHHSSGVTSFTGIDLSRGMLHQAEIAARQSDVPARLVQMDGQALAFPDASFDTVATSLMLCTVPSPERALREMARVCRPDGRVVLLEHVLAPNRLVAWLQRKATPMQVQHMGCHFDRRTDHLVRDLGFRVEYEEARFFRIFRLIIARPPTVQHGPMGAPPSDA